MCLACGGLALYQEASDDGEWAVEIGPIPSKNFRDKALAQLESLLADFDPRGKDALLAESRVRVTGGLTKPIAEALAQGLGKQATAAAVVRGPVASLGAAGAFRHGLPLLAMLGGAVLGFAWDWTYGLLLGTAAATGLGVMNAGKKQPVLGAAPIAPALPPALQSAPLRFAAVAPTLPADVRELASRAIAGGFAVLTRLSRDGDLVALGAGGLEGGMGKAAVELVLAAVTNAEAWTKTTQAPEREARRSALTRLATAAEEASAAVDKLDLTMSGSGGDLEERLKQESALVLETARELAKTVN